MYVYMYVSIYVCMYACMHACVYICDLCLCLNAIVKSMWKVGLMLLCPSRPQS